MHPMLNTAIKAARRAGNIINRASFDVDLLKITQKKHNDFVTEVDQAAEAAIINILRTAYPEHAFLAEESGASNNLHDEHEYVWIIDPLDGTTNFIHGLPVYAVSIALAQRGQITQAVVYDPARNEMFTASRGSGSFLNDRRMRVSGQIRYHDALLGAHVPGSAGGESRPSRFSSLLSGCASARRLGSTVLGLAYVAAGRFDGFCGMNLKPWDMAAGSLLVLEAGGLVGDFAGEQEWLESGSVLAASPKIFTQMLGHIQTA
jgi:myo-inositol-1(or 4)-monophosphatase